MCQYYKYQRLNKFEQSIVVLGKQFVIQLLINFSLLTNVEALFTILCEVKSSHGKYCENMHMASNARLNSSGQR